MKKDKAWLKGLINEEGIVTDMNLLGRHDEQYWKNENIKINKGRLFYLIDQLDEPEKVVVPSFIADYIERAKPRHDSLYQAMEERAGEEVNEWIQAFYNSDKFVRAWLYGYEVEKEQKYILSINITDKASKTNYETFLNKRGIFHSMENESFNSEEFNWTEEEIKELESGEILFEYFATKVEELEE